MEYISTLSDLSTLKSALAAARNEATEAKREYDQRAEKVKAFEVYNKPLIADANATLFQARAYVSQIDQHWVEHDGIKPELKTLNEMTIVAIAKQDSLKGQLWVAVEQVNELRSTLATAEAERDRLGRDITNLWAEHKRALYQISSYVGMLDQYKADVTATEKASDL